MNDHVTLMQIDCSVVNTTIVKLKSEALPKNLRKSKKPNDSPKPENKFNKDTIDASLIDILKNSSNNVPSYDSNIKENHLNRHIDIGKDSFSSYLYSKANNKNGKGNKTIQKDDIAKLLVN